MTYIKLQLKNYYDHIFFITCPLGSPKGTLYLKVMRHHDAYIKNTIVTCLNQ